MVRFEAATCGVCERSLLVGERPTRFSPDGRAFVVVCPLCKEKAVELGWFYEGGPSLPHVHPERRRGRGRLASLLGLRGEAGQSSVADPVLRRLSAPEQAMVEAADVFNQSGFRRSVEGIARSLGSPQVSIAPLSGRNREVVITIAWDISWYQYRVDFDAPHPVRLAERGLEPGEIPAPFTVWNAHFTDDGFVVPELEPI